MLLYYLVLCIIAYVKAVVQEFEYQPFGLVHPNRLIGLFPLDTNSFNNIAPLFDHRYVTCLYVVLLYLFYNILVTNRLLKQ